MITVYTTNRLNPLRIFPVQANSLTKDFVFVDGKYSKNIKLRRYPKGGTQYHETPQEAKAQLIRYQEQAIATATANLKLLQQEM